MPSADLAAANQRLLALRRDMQSQRNPQGARLPLLHSQKSNTHGNDAAKAWANALAQKRAQAHHSQPTTPARRPLPRNPLAAVANALEGQEETNKHQQSTLASNHPPSTTHHQQYTLASNHPPSTTSHQPLAIYPNANLVISPSILHAMLREEQAAVGRVWLLCRHLDVRGAGWLSINDLRVVLTRKSNPHRICGWRRLRQILQQGKEIFWERDDRGRLWLYGAAKVAARLGLDSLQYRPIAFPILYLLKNIQQTRAAFYASVHAARDGNPISRATLEQVTAVPERTQRLYDTQLGIERKTNYAIGKEVRGDQNKQASATAEALREELYTRSGGAFLFHDKQGHVGPADRHYVAHQLPNSYVSPWAGGVEHKLGRTRWQQIRRQLRQHLVNLGTQGNGPDQTTYLRRYHTTGKILQTPPATECTYVQNNMSKHNRTQQYWIQYM